MNVHQNQHGTICRPIRLLSRRRTRGAAMLELALVLPILLMLFFGIIEVGRMMMLNQVTTNAAREGSRRAILPGMTNENVEAIINDYLDRGSISNTGRSIQILDEFGTQSVISDIKSHSQVVIEITIPYNENSFGFTRIFGSTNLTSRSTMRRE